MRRACYSRKPNNTYHVDKVRSVNNNGTIDIEPIPELSNDFVSLESLFMNANRKGYGIIGDYDEIKKENFMKFYEKKCGKNKMDIDEL